MNPETVMLCGSNEIGLAIKNLSVNSGVDQSDIEILIVNLSEKTGFSEKDVIETINSVIFAQNTPDIILSLKNVVGPFEKMLVDDNRPLKSYHSFIPKPIGRQRRVKR
jgi:hypothetical protein